MKNIILLGTFFLFGYSNVIAQNVNIIPRPNEITTDKGSFTIDKKNIRIHKYITDGYRFIACGIDTLYIREMSEKIITVKK